MRFEDERYVRLYTRDTTTWLMLPWQSRAVAPLILRKVDRAGILDLGDDGIEGLAVHIGIPFEVVAPGVDGLVKRGVVELHAGALVWPRFIEGQESKQSDVARARASRELARATFGTPQEQGDARTRRRLAQSKGLTNREPEPERLTNREPGHTPCMSGLTPAHGDSRELTATHSVLCCAVPNQETPKPPSGAPCVLVSDEPERPAIDAEPTSTLVPTRDHEPAEWRAGQTTDDGLFGMLDAEYDRGLREGLGRPVAGIAGRSDKQALRAVCAAHALDPAGAPLRSQALLVWVFAAAKEFASSMPSTLTPTVTAFKGWLNRGRKHFDAGPKKHPSEANAPAPFREFKREPKRVPSAGVSPDLLSILGDEHADSGAATGARSDVRARDAPDIDPEEIGTSQGNVGGIARNAGGAR